MSDMANDGVFADYLDGNTALLRRVSVNFISADGGAYLQLHPAEGDDIIWPFHDIRRIPDQAARDSAVYGLTGTDQARLIVRDAGVNAKLQAICPNLKRPELMPGMFKRLVMLAAGAVASVALIVWVLVPIMADQLAVLLPVEGEKALGDKTYEQIRQALDRDSRFGLWECDANDGLAALDKMAARLSAGANLPYDMQLHVLDHKLVNAFALPGGHIVLFEGLLKDAKSAEEVAGVLGHEMGHLEHRDPTRLALRSAGSVGVLGLLLGDFAGGTAILFLSEKLIQAQYSRGAEADADTYAHNLLAAAGLPTGPMADFFDRLHEKHGSSEDLTSHLSSHPDSKGRSEVARAANTVGDDFDPVLSPSEWAALKRICVD
jgi:Zn-dependent protease with chaperone function